MNTTIEIDTNKERLNLKLIHDFIKHSYWGEGRTFEDMKRSIENSFNFGVYKNGLQIGYARIITDGVFFAYLMDVFILSSERKRGYSKALISHILDHPDLKNIKTWQLKTTDAHSLYQKYGFRNLTDSDNLMEKKL